jgi:hypothetical protein
LTVRCAPVEGAPPRARCTLTQTTIAKASPEDLTSAFVAIEKTVAADDGARLLAEQCVPARAAGAASAPSSETAREAELAAAVRSACEKKDAFALRHALLQRIRFRAEVCSVRTVSDEVELSLVDRDTWTSLGAPGAWCGGTSTVKLWRAPGEPRRWRYERTSSPGRAPADARCAARAPAPTTLTAGAAGVREPGCRYVEVQPAEPGAPPAARGPSSGGAPRP